MDARLVRSSCFCLRKGNNREGINLGETKLKYINLILCREKDERKIVYTIVHKYVDNF